MEPSVVALVLSSAVLHPLWMAFIKRGGGPESSFLGLMVVIALLGFVTALVTGADLMAVGRVWRFILISTFGLVLYCSFQALTLRRGDLLPHRALIAAVHRRGGGAFPRSHLLGIDARRNRHGVGRGLPLAGAAGRPAP